MPRKPKDPPESPGSTLKRLLTPTPHAQTDVPSTGLSGLQQTLQSTALWTAGYEQGVKDTIKALEKDPAFAGALHEAAKWGAATPEQQKTLALIAALRTLPSRTAPTGESAAEKSARIRRTHRVLRDEAQAAELAALIRAGDTTDEARAKMGIGVVRAQRIRAVAVRLGLLKPRQRADEPGNQ